MGEAAVVEPCSVEVEVVAAVQGGAEDEVLGGWGAGAPSQLALPVAHDARGAEDQARPVVRVAHRHAERLQALAQPHLVGEQRAPVALQQARGGGG